MSQNLRDYTKALYGFDRVVKGAAPSAWAERSPCPDWNARQVVGHVISVVRMVTSLASTGGFPPPPWPTEDEAAGPDPVAAWGSARDGVLEALDHAGVLHRSTPTPFGEMEVDQFLGIIVADALTHTWDLARAVGGDETLDPDLVAKCHAALGPLEAALRVPGRMGAPVEVGAGADAQTRFLAFTGRRA